MDNRMRFSNISLRFCLVVLLLLVVNANAHSATLAVYIQTGSTSGEAEAQSVCVTQGFYVYGYKNSSYVAGTIVPLFYSTISSSVEFSCLCGSCPGVFIFSARSTATCEIGSFMSASSWTGDDFICGAGPLVCTPPLVPDAAGTRCVTQSCPVLPLTHPPFSDACSTSLEQGKGVDVNNKCGKLRDDMDKAASCIADKIKALSSPKVDYSSPSATVRTAEYQDHLLEIWTKSQQLDTIMNSAVYTPETKQACAATYAAVKKEKAEHGIKHQPSSAADAAPHVERRAIDIPSSIVDSLTAQVTIEVTTYSIVNGERKPTTTITSDIEDYMNSKTINPSPACKSSPDINWGGGLTRLIGFISISIKIKEHHHD